MNTDRHGLKYEEIVHEFVGCVMEMLNELGDGWRVILRRVSQACRGRCQIFGVRK